MTPQELEFEIKRCHDEMLRAAPVDPDTAIAWFRNMAHLISERSDEVVREMEKKMGIR